MRPPRRLTLRPPKMLLQRRVRSALISKWHHCLILKPVYPSVHPLLLLLRGALIYGILGISCPADFYSPPARHGVEP